MNVSNLEATGIIKGNFNGDVSGNITGNLIGDVTGNTKRQFIKSEWQI